jgi:hemerythrin-like metal-binding protein
MKPMEWSSALELGVDAMDETHREFVRHVNELGEASEPDMLARLDALYAHTVEHFRQEMQWMEQISFPPLHCHAAEHEGVLEVMREVRGYLEAGKYEVGRVLAREVAAWFQSHAATMDAMLAQVMKANFDGTVQAESCGAGCAPVLADQEQG